MSTTTSRTERHGLFLFSSPGFCSLSGVWRLHRGEPRRLHEQRHLPMFRRFSRSNVFGSCDDGARRQYDFALVDQRDRNHRWSSRRRPSDRGRWFDHFLPLASPIETQFDVVNHLESNDDDDVELARNSLGTDRRTCSVQRSRLAPLVRRFVRQNDQLSSLRRIVIFSNEEEKKAKISIDAERLR